MPLRYPLSSFRRDTTSFGGVRNSSSNSSWHRRRRRAGFTHQEALFVLVLAGSLVTLVTVLVSERESSATAPIPTAARRAGEAITSKDWDGEGGEADSLDKPRKSRVQAEVDRLAANVRQLAERPPPEGSSVGLAANHAQRQKQIRLMEVSEADLKGIRGTT